MVLPVKQENNQEQNSGAIDLAKGYAKGKVKKAGKKLGKKAAKKLAKLAAKAVKKGVAVLAKMLLTFLGSIGAPALIVFGIVVIAVIIVSLSLSFFLGKGESLTSEEQDLHDYMVQKTEETVDMSDPLQAPYKLPVELLSAVIQIDGMQGEDYYELVDKFTESLAPSFSYNEYNEWSESKTQVCRNDKCEKWSDVDREDKWVTKLTGVEHWEGGTHFEHDDYITDWKSDVVYKTEQEEYIEYETVTKTVSTKVPYREKEYVQQKDGTWKEEYVTKHKVVKETVEERVPVEKVRDITVKTTTMTRHQRFNTTETTTHDYSNFDSILNSYGLGLNDKRMISANYEFQGLDISYLEWLESDSSAGFGSGISYDGTIVPGEGIPAEYMPIYLAAEKKYGVDWYTLAAIHFVETGFSTHPTMVSSVGAVGHLQFMPATWAGWKYNIGGGLVSAGTDITSLSVIKAGGGYGVDGNGDGKADPWQIEDAIHTAANYLAGSNYASDQRGAIYNYNHANWYVDKVLKNANKFKSQATYTPNGGGDVPQVTSGAFMRPATGDITSTFGIRWGTYHNGIDIGGGGRSNVQVVASADGVVVKSYLSSSYGNTIIIRHNIEGKQYETLYAHLASRKVSAGANVKKGQFIGYMGNTGQSTGMHLHFELHSPAWNSTKSGKLDPVKYVQF
ncbi:peptidoglycan DD-metalloendopeptidase family protein [Terribacillus saccharophilus]|uniref:peptidoglycan DD-metalloendopeptidase family protein n=1 Tax=Terribacillus saccharophilus TaxID=361277 RepID=UPI0037FFC2B7